MKISAFPALLLIATLTACNSVAVYEPIVDTSNIEDPQQYEVDYAACEDITNRVDYSDERTKAALKGGALGFGVVGAGVATTLAAGGCGIATSSRANLSCCYLFRRQSKHRKS